MIPRNACVAGAALLTCIACGGNDPGPVQSPPPTYTLGGTVNGLHGSGLKLQNGTSHLPIAADGAFTFPDSLASGASYSVSIESQPTNPDQVCTVANGGGTVDHANITNVGIACSTLETSRRWQAPTLIEQVPGITEDTATVAVNAHGTAVAAWRREPANGLFQIWASRYSPDTRTWSAPVRIGPESGTGNFGAAGPPNLAVTDDGSTVVVWPQFENGRVEVLASQYTDSRGWGAATRVDAADSVFATSPVVVFDSNGNALVVWEQSDGVNDHVDFSRLASGTTTWSAPVQIDTAAASSSSAQLAADAHGNVVVIWLQSQSSQGNFTSQIWSSIYANGGTWGDPVLVGGDPASRASNGRVVSNGNGIAQALWQQLDGSLWTNRYTPGNGWGTAKLIESAASGAGMAELAIDQDGNALAVWQTSLMQNAHISYSRFSATDGWSAPAPIAPTQVGVTEFAEFPQVAFDGQGNAIALWTGLIGPQLDARSALYTPGTGWGDAVSIATDVLAAKLDVAPDGTGIVVWEQAASASTTTLLSSRFE